MRDLLMPMKQPEACAWRGCVKSAMGPDVFSIAVELEDVAVLDVRLPIGSGCEDLWAAIAWLGPGANPSEAHRARFVSVDTHPRSKPRAASVAARCGLAATRTDQDRPDPAEAGRGAVNRRLPAPSTRVVNRAGTKDNAKARRGGRRWQPANYRSPPMSAIPMCARAPGHLARPSASRPE